MRQRTAACTGGEIPALRRKMMKRFSALLMLLSMLLVSATRAQRAAVVFCALDDTLDFKTVKAGDAIELHTSRDLMEGDKVLLPRGTAVIANVVAVEDGKTVSVVLDKATLKAGKTVPLMGIIVAVANVEKKDLTNDPLYGMNHSTEVSQHSMPGTGLDSNASVATSGAAAQTAIMKGKNEPKTMLSADSQGAIGIDGLELKWVLDKPPATTVFTSKKRNLKIKKGSEVLLRMAPPEV
jgi:hypothetical protein